MDDLYNAAAMLQGTLSAAKDAEIPNSAWERFRSDRGFRERTRKFWEGGGYSDPRLEGTPSALYGPRTAVFGPKEWEAFFKVRLTQEQLRAAQNFPWKDVTDRTFGAKHFFFLGLDAVHSSHSEGSYQVPLDVDGLVELTEKWAHWANRPRLDLTTWMIPGGGMPAGTPKTRWYALQLDRTREKQYYRTMNVAECLLAHILFYQKHGRHLASQPLVCSDMAGAEPPKRLVVDMDHESKRVLVRSADTFEWQVADFALSRKLPS